MTFQSLLEWDARLSAHIRVAERSRPVRTVAGVLAHSGDSWFWLAGLAFLWFAGGEYWQGRALEMGVGIVVTALLVMALKFTIRRGRPEGEWGGIYRRSDPHSFPSGHAARAMMLAVLALGLGPTWLGVLLLAWAPLVGLARVLMGVHFLSDVVAGMVVGMIMGGLVLEFYPWRI